MSYRKHLMTSDEPPSELYKAAELGTNMAEVGTDVPDTNVGDMISRQDAIDAVEESRRLNHHKDGKEACAHEYEHRHFLKILSELPSAEPELLWITCFDCPLSHGCPAIKGCTNEQAMEYAGEIPDNCPLNKISAEPERKTGKWIYGEHSSGQDGWFCSECNFFEPWYYGFYGLGDIDFIRDYHTCPGCDAKMITYTGSDKDGRSEQK